MTETTELPTATVMKLSQTLPRFIDFITGRNLQHNILQLVRFMTLLTSPPLIYFAPLRHKRWLAICWNKQGRVNEVN